MFRINKISVWWATPASRDVATLPTLTRSLQRGFCSVDYLTRVKIPARRENITVVILNSGWLENKLRKLKK